MVMDHSLNLMAFLITFFAVGKRTLLQSWKNVVLESEQLITSHLASRTRHIFLLHQRVRQD